MNNEALRSEFEAWAKDCEDFYPLGRDHDGDYSHPDTRDAYKLWQGWSEARGKDAERLSEIHSFLLGESSLDGCWFGDSHPTKTGKFWWRSFLRAAMGKEG